MFLKKKEKDPNWDNRKEWEWSIMGPQKRPALNLTSKNYIGGIDSHITIEDPSRQANIVQILDDREIEQNRRTIIAFSDEVRKNNNIRFRKALKGLGDKLFGKW